MKKKLLMLCYRIFTWITPLKIRTWIMDFNARHLYKIEKERVSQISILDADEEIQSCINYINAKRRIHIFNYPFIEKYWPNRVKVFYDKEEKMHYVLAGEKRLYYPKSFSRKQIMIYHNSLLLENDSESPHRYFDESFFVQSGDILFDIGAAEGIVTLTNIERVSKAIIFECSKEWLEALEKTFGPWGKKVQIVQKFVSSRDLGNEVTLDSYIKAMKVNSNDQLMIKCDIEGNEKDFLYGAKSIFAMYKVKCAICTYHNERDYKDIVNILEKYGLKYQPTKGLMYPAYDKNRFDKKGFRKGLIRANNIDKRV